LNHYYAMIMAGGGGTRLWPKSRQNTPKQLLPLVEDDSMFKISVERLAPLFSPERIYVVTGELYLDALRKDAPAIPAENFIVEPYGKDSGPAAALGMAFIQKRDPEAVIAILTADHHISEKDKFRDVLAAAYDIAITEGLIVTLGISPSFPSTAFGYIKRGSHLGEKGNFNYYHSEGFKEKPSPHIALQYLRSSRYSWNSGMFIWTAQRALQEFAAQQPQMHAMIQAITDAIGTDHYAATLKTAWEKIERLSLDYAVMERAQDMCVIPIDIGWSDVGSWAALFEILETDSVGNTFKGNTQERVNIDTQQTMVYSDRLVVTIGVRDIIVIDTPDALLICHRDRTQEVKDVVKALHNQSLDEYL